MKHDFVKIFALVLALVLALGVAGCARKTPEGTTGATGAAVLPENGKATEPGKETTPGKATAPTGEQDSTKPGAADSTKPGAADSTKPSAAERPTVPPAPAEVQTAEPQHTHSYKLSRIVSARCTEGGYTVYACSCGEAYQDDYTPALGHSWGDWSVTRDATYSEGGEETRTCSVCGTSETRATAKLEAPALDYQEAMDVGNSYAASTYGAIIDTGCYDGYNFATNVTVSVAVERGGQSYLNSLMCDFVDGLFADLSRRDISDGGDGSTAGYRCNCQIWDDGTGGVWIQCYYG